jgi:hypothetical protein
VDEVKDVSRFILEKESVIKTIRDSKQKPSARTGKDSPVRKKSEPDL